MKVIAKFIVTEITEGNIVKLETIHDISIKETVESVFEKCYNSNQRSMTSLGTTQSKTA